MDNMSRLKGIIENNKGVTLIELLIAISILGVVLAIATSMIIQAYNIVPSGTRRMSAKQLAEMHVTEIARHVRNAHKGDTIEIVENGGNGEVVIGDGSEYDEDFSEPVRIELYNDEGEKIGTYHDISSFKIAYIGNANGQYSYEITLEKEHDDEKGKVTTKVTPRN